VEAGLVLRWIKDSIFLGSSCLSYWEPVRSLLACLLLSWFRLRLVLALNCVSTVIQGCLTQF
jgi:hypothetical protein